MHLAIENGAIFFYTKTSNPKVQYSELSKQIFRLKVVVQVS